MGPFGNLRSIGLAAAMLIAAGWCNPGRAQDPDDLKRAVARISLMEGEVSVRRGDSADWVAGVLNAPLLADDRISTGPNSRAEIQFDSANVMRIGGNAEVRLVELEYSRYQMEIAHGTVTYAVIRPSNINVEIDTPSVSVRPSQQGVYRINVNDAGESQVTARAGNVEVFTPRGSQWVNAGQSLMARGTMADPEFQIVAAIPVDDWDRWNESRDRAMLQSRSAQYTPPGVYGTEDLDQYGSWDYMEPYGYAWHPRAVAADWAPYSAGRWVWEDWYGWTWVSYDPWGWAPYHYGRWFHHARYGWSWYPGVIGVRHYWSPALVAWIGFGGGSGVGFGFGNVGWVPLAPYEVCHPWWGRSFYRSPAYINRSVHITNINVTNVYRNARIRNGISAVAYGDFQHGRFQNIRRYSGDNVREAGLVRGQMPIAPGNEHLRFSDRRTAFVPRNTENVRFFRQQQPAPSQRTPFALQQRGLAGRGAEPDRRGAGGGAPAGAGSNGFRGQQGQGNISPRGVDSGASRWRRFGEPGTQSVETPRGDQNGWRGNQRPGNPDGRQQILPAPSQGAPSVDRGPSQRGNRGGWQRFGEPGGSVRQAPQNAPQNNGRDARDRQWGQFGSPGAAAPRQDFRQERRYDAAPRQQEQMRVAPPVVRERQNAPSFDRPRSNASPRSNGGNNNFGAPRSFGGGGGNFSAPRSNGGGQRNFGGGGGGQRNFGGGGGGGGSRSHGGGSRHR